MTKMEMAAGNGGQVGFTNFLHHPTERLAQRLNQKPKNRRENRDRFSLSRLNPNAAKPALTL
jgi:hypothetical protein